MEEFEEKQGKKGEKRRSWRNRMIYPVANDVPEPIEEEANEEGVLSPMDRVKYYNLREKLAKVKVAHIYAETETIDLHYFHLSGYSGLRELILDMVPPSTVLDFISLRDKLVSLEVVNAGIPDMAEALAKGVSRSLLKEFMPMVLQRSPRMQRFC